MKFLKRISLPLFALMLFFSSCQKDAEIDNTGIVDPVIETETIELNPIVARNGGANGDGLDFDCFSITYPFDMVEEDGTIHTLDSEESFVTLFDEEVFIVDFVYPLNVEDQDGNSSEVNDGEELAAAFALCLPDGGWQEGYPAYLIDAENSCFDLAYPVSLIDWDGNTLEVSDQAALTTAVAEGIYLFAFPLNLIEEDGTTLTVNDTDGLIDALVSCNGIEIPDTFLVGGGIEYLGCYIIEFPLELVLLDGTTVTVNNHEEYCDLMLQGEIANYSFPLTLTDEEGNVTTVTNEAELGALLNECWDDVFFGGEGYFELSILYQGTQVEDPNTMEPCYAIAYPLTIETDGESEEIADNAGVEEILNGMDPEELYFDLQYPISVVFSDGTTTAVDGIESIFVILDECQ